MGIFADEDGALYCLEHWNSRAASCGENCGGCNACISPQCAVPGCKNEPIILQNGTGALYCVDHAWDSDRIPREERRKVKEPWRCGACSSLIYDVESKDGIPGAPLVPIEQSINARDEREVDPYGRVCETCYDLYSNLRYRQYWVNLHAAEVNRKKNIMERGDTK